MRLFYRPKERTKEPVQLIDNYNKVGHVLNIRIHYGNSVFDIERVGTCSLCGHTMKMRELYYDKQQRCPFCACKIEL